MDGIPRGKKLCQQPEDWVKGHTMYFKTVCKYTCISSCKRRCLYHGERESLLKQMYFLFLGGGGGGGISRGHITGILW